MNKELIGGASVLGYSHKKTNKPNQDSLKIYQAKDNNIAIISVADGHGSDIYFRSDIGSQFAVKAAEEVLLKYVKSLNFERFDIKNENVIHFNNELIRNAEFELIKQDILFEWKNLVSEHLVKEPFILESIDLTKVKGLEKNIDVETKYYVKEKNTSIELSKTSFKKLKDNPISAYGTTLMSFLKFNLGAILVNIGDGDIVLTTNGTSCKAFNKDDKMIANETYSLSNTDYTKIDILYLSQIPDIAILCTDGVSNSFSDDSIILGLGNELFLEYQNKNDVKDFEKLLSGYLENVTKKGSGDDCTLAFYMNILKLEENEKGEIYHGIE